MSKEVTARLFALQDEAYAAFQRKLMPTIAPQRVIGVRQPALRRLAKELAGTATAAEFLRSLPHEYYEENNLHGALLSLEKNYDACLAGVKAFLPYVDNWATCDMLKPQVFARHRPALLEEIRLWLQSEAVYTVRFGLNMLMSHFLDGDFSPEYLALAASVRSGEYYVNMMQAWYFATALAKQYAATLPWLEQNRLGVWVHNKTIQKAVESYRITPAQKAHLKSLKRKP